MENLINILSYVLFIRTNKSTSNPKFAILGVEISKNIVITLFSFTDKFNRRKALVELVIRRPRYTNFQKFEHTIPGHFHISFLFDGMFIRIKHDGVCENIVPNFGRVNYQIQHGIAGYSITDLWRIAQFWQPVYASYWSRDCDMCETADVRKYRNYFQYLKAIESYGEWADGPFTLNEITKGEYLMREGETYHRDRVMEAYENGNGRSIYV
jgi:hypothetical protein